MKDLIEDHLSCAVVLQKQDEKNNDSGNFVDFIPKIVRWMTENAKTKTFTEK